jgi:hypothetical protein
MVALHKTYGNRNVTRWLQRQSAAAAAAKPGVQWPTPKAELESLAKLRPAALETRRGAQEIALLHATGDQRKALLQEMRLIEFVQGKDSEAKLPKDAKLTRPEKLSIVLRRLIEHETRGGRSLDVALLSVGNYMRFENDESDKVREEVVRTVRADGEAFGKEFSSLGKANAWRVIIAGHRALQDVLASYGLPPSHTQFAVEEIMKNGEGFTHQAASEYVAVAHKVDEERPRYRATANKREELHQVATGITALQATIAQLDELAHPAPGTGAGSRAGPMEETLQAQKDLDAARKKLQSEWDAARAGYPILDAYRRDKDQSLESVNVSGLVGDEDKLATDVAEHVLPKLVNLTRALDYVTSGRVSPLRLPAVVDLSRRDMFVAPGSLWDGVVNDLVKDAHDTGVSGYVIAALLIAFAALTLLPSGGGSLGIALNLAVLAGIDAPAIGKDIAHYQEQEALVDTALDRTKSLSQEEPSLNDLIWDLFAAGLDAGALELVIGQVRNLRQLVREGRDTGKAVGALNDLAKNTYRLDDKVGDKALETVRKHEVTAAKPKLPPEPHPPETRPTRPRPGGGPTAPDEIPSKPAKKKIARPVNYKDPHTGIRSGTGGTGGGRPPVDHVAVQGDRLSRARLSNLREELADLPVGRDKDLFAAQLANLSDRELQGLEQIARVGSQSMDMSSALADLLKWTKQDRAALLDLVAEVGPRAGHDGFESVLHSIFQRTVETGEEVHGVTGSWGELLGGRKAIREYKATHLEFQVRVSDGGRNRVVDIIAETPRGNMFFEVKANVRSRGGIIEHEVKFDLIYYAKRDYNNLRYLYDPNVTKHQRDLLGERMLALFDEVKNELPVPLEQAKAAFRKWLKAGGLGVY